MLIKSSPSTELRVQRNWINVVVMKSFSLQSFHQIRQKEGWCDFTPSKHIEKYQSRKSWIRSVWGSGSDIKDNDFRKNKINHIIWVQKTCVMGCEQRNHINVLWVTQNVFLKNLSITAVEVKGTYCPTPGLSLAFFSIDSKTFGTIYLEYCLLLRAKLFEYYPYFCTCNNWEINVVGLTLGQTLKFVPSVVTMQHSRNLGEFFA